MKIWFSIGPETKTRRINRVLLSKLVEAHGTASLASRTPAYDGSKSLYTAGELPFESMDFVVKLAKESREMYGITNI
jgi:eukaryotic translation initiation factor 2C